MDEEDGLLIRGQDLGHLGEDIGPVASALGAQGGDGLLLSIGETEGFITSRGASVGAALPPILGALLSAVGPLIHPGAEGVELGVGQGGREAGGEGPGRLLTAPAGALLGIAGGAGLGHRLADDGDLGVGEVEAVGEPLEALLAPLGAVGRLGADGEWEREGGEDRQSEKEGHGIRGWWFGGQERHALVPVRVVRV